jgi:hypothetical protein
MPVYVGERYVPEAKRELAMAQLQRIRAAVLQLASEGSPVALLSTTFVPDEEWVFDLFQAESAEQVTRVYSESGVLVERVAEGVHLPGPSTAEGD